MGKGRAQRGTGDRMIGVGVDILRSRVSGLGDRESGTGYQVQVQDPDLTPEPEHPYP